MFKLTERIGEIELTYEADTVEGVIALKNAANPHVLVHKEPLNTQETLWVKETYRLLDEIKRTPPPPPPPAKVTFGG